MAIPKLPTKLIPWATTFESVISANPARYNYAAPDIVPLTTATTALVAAQAAVANPDTRSSSLVMARNAAVEAYFEVARTMYAAIQCANDISDEYKAEAGVRVKSTPSPVPAPSEAPEIDVLSVTGRMVKGRLHGTTIEHRRMPSGCSGAYIWSYAGETFPEDLAGWSFWGTSSKTLFEVEFAPSVEAGTKVWGCAAWINRKGETGPVCDPVSTYTQFGGVTVSAAQAKKKAA